MQEKNVLIPVSAQGLGRQASDLGGSGSAFCSACRGFTGGGGRRNKVGTEIEPADGHDTVLAQVAGMDRERDGRHVVLARSWNRAKLHGPCLKPRRMIKGRFSGSEIDWP